MKPVVALTICCLALLSYAVHAHDLITPELAEGYLERAARWHEQSQSEPDKIERAKAHLRIGVMLDEIRGYLNRDLAVHGEVQGLASNYLVAELKRIGTPLAYSETRRFFVANSDYYRAALEAGLGGRLGTEARLRLLRGEFYDSFGVDPLQTNQSPAQVQAQAKLAEGLVEAVTAEPDREEVLFIAAIVYARAAKAADDRALRAEFRGRALGYADAFQSAYPDSLRSAAMPVVREAMRGLD